MVKWFTFMENVSSSLVKFVLMIRVKAVTLTIQQMTKFKLGRIPCVTTLISQHIHCYLETWDSKLPGHRIVR